MTSENGVIKRHKRRRNSRRPPLILTTTTLLLLLLPITITTAYLGPTHCTKPGTSATSALQSQTKGYSTFNHLLFDLTSLASTFRNGQPIPNERLKFQLCPNTIINLDDTSLPLGHLPIAIPRVTIQCGESGERSNSCTIRGGGKHSPSYQNWNQASKLKETLAGIVGGGSESVAQVYVYGKDAYEVTLRGLTFDNGVNGEEMERYREYVNVFGVESVMMDDFVAGGRMEGDGGSNGNGENVEEELLSSGSGFSSRRATITDESLQYDGGHDKQYERSSHQNNRQEQEAASIPPAYRFAAVAVRGNGYGDDAGARIITIEDCKFQWHRGYAILVSPGIQEPTLPKVPASAVVNTVAQTFNNNGNNNNNNVISASNNIMGETATTNEGGARRRLNLLDNGANFIPSDGKVSYYDNTASINYLDSRRVMITKTEFVNNIAAVNNVAGLVTSAYSLTMTDCFFQSNDAKAMVFAYNNDALVKNTIFTDNKVDTATIVLASPEGSKRTSSTPTHLVEQTCFLGSNVGMSNVLATDVEATGFGQRENHAAGTQFSWVSNCEGAAAESLGHECLESGKCDGTCVRFDSEQCLADMTKTHHSAASRTTHHLGWAIAVSISSLVIFG
eukprot:CAMPEP_0201714978 /NCGR_PEP_ID=MMETSP0593-20130828/1241_1 /ASSEMBLY_ACC=CAM_ASM_000672 /TAXON_ID=267983 /ORGANISM="Skeletonema japonicum, Strain CCMP2506" /LENGTH=618 /DNA_ID=CAMNT_0048204321 /DNA_START=89 /DNA_END=1942 /DNA_ORIENTATION=-